MNSISSANFHSDLVRDLKEQGLPPIATLNEVAAAARCTYQHVWSCVQMRKLTAFKRGGRWLARRDDVARWMTSKD